ncbi:hypothetical protein F5Y11DRAFT_322377 [Daldinia sp. FL1419]|nr:hypothetical protein F5Y11DRAFT_322377 [Daldinia sp. FL1419]
MRQHTALVGLGLSATALGAMIPTDAPTVTTFAAEPVALAASVETGGFSPAHIPCREAELRCNGQWEEICDGFGVWQRWQKCAECLNDSNGNADCIPNTDPPPREPKPNFCKENQLRCNGHWEEICDNDAEWHRLMQCDVCSQDTAGSVECVPYVDLPPQPPAAPQCVQGTLRCSGTWLDLCGSELKWQHVQHCSQCVTDPDGQPFCDDGQLHSSPPASAPTPTPTATSSAPATSAPVPAPTPRSPDAHAAVDNLDNPCFPGEVRCNGDRVEACDKFVQWQDFGPCPSCKQLYNTRVKCHYDENVESTEPIYRTVSA